MNKRKILLILLIAILSLSIVALTACGNDTSTDADDSVTGDTNTDDSVTDDTDDADTNVDDDTDETFITITFNSNGGSEVLSQQLTASDVSTEPTEPTLDGYIFAGWNLDTAKYTFGQSHSEDITLTAQWRGINYTVMLDANIGSMDNTLETFDCTYGTEQLITNLYSMGQYHVTSWNTAVDGSGTDYYDMSDISMLTTTDNDTVTLYAQWLLGTVGMQYIQLDDGTYGVYSGSGTDVIVPAMYHGASVTAIYNSAFSGCSSLVSITLPDTITSIGNSSFYDCESLVSVTLPDSVTSIGNYAFGVCFGLQHITLPDGITAISSSTFMGCTSLVSIDMPDSLVSIGSDAFMFCSMLSSIVIPQGVTSIGGEAFGHCYSLVEVYNLSSLILEAGSADCGGVAYYAVSISDNLQTNLVTDSNGFVTYTQGSSVTLIDYVGTVADITIPSNITYIANYAFYNNSTVTSIVIPDSVVGMGEGAFYNCSSLASVKLPQYITSIADRAFYRCSALDSILLPDSVTSIGSSAFALCSKLTTITIGSNVDNIGSYAFGSCALQYIYYNATNATWTPNEDYYPFKACGADNCQLIIGSNVQSIASYMFDNFSNLATVTFEDDSQLASIGDYAFYGCSGLSTITIPSLVTSIGYYSFGNCSGLQSAQFEDTDTWYYSMYSDYTLSKTVNFDDMQSLLTILTEYYYLYKA